MCYRRRGRIRRHTGSKQRMRDCAGSLHAHVDHQRSAAFCKRLPVRLVAIARMTGDEGNAARHLAVRDRDPQRRRHRDARGDSGNHFKWHAGSSQRQGFFTAAAKDERVASFETRDDLPLSGEPHE